MSSVAHELVVAIDSGTSSTKVIVSDLSGAVLARSSAPIGLHTPAPGWVEQDAEDIAFSCDRAVEQVLAEVDPVSVAAVGVSNQRESLLLWSRATGRPVSPVISWQDRRTRELARELLDAGHGDVVRATSGLPLDPMFSALKAKWLLDAFDPGRRMARGGEYCLGTVDSWLAWKLTGEHVTEPGNASRTSLLDISTGLWSEVLLDIFDVPEACLPRLRPSAGSDLIVSNGGLAGRPLSGILGDSHAALFSHQGWRSGTAKVTLGTGSSVMAAADPVVDSPGLCRTIAWQLPDSVPTVALEGNILSAGSTIAWLAGVLGTTPEDLIAEAEASNPHSRVALVPAFDGLGAPWWDASATALVTGLSLATTRADLAQAALNSVVMQVADLTDAFVAAGVSLSALVADGGLTRSTRLMQDLADQTGVPVRVAHAPEASALGAADIAGVGAGLWGLVELEHRSMESLELMPRQGTRPQQASSWAHALEIARTHT